MAYCLRSFAETLDQVLNPHKHFKKWVLDLDHRPQIQSLFENATFLQKFLDNSSPLIQEKISSLEDKIMEAAEEGANTLETHITSQILSSPEGQSFVISPPDLGQVLQAFEVAKQEVIKIQPVNHTVSPPVSSTRYPDSKYVVGVTEVLNQLRSRLTARATKFDIIPIVGMGGMGKTTLARILYDEYSSSKSHFDCFAWVTVSQSYDTRQILKTLLDGLGKPSNEMPQQEMIVSLHKTLFSRRYLIVIDDIWSCKAWDDVQRAFPQDYNGSRIILTTRENTLVDYVKSDSHEMHLMNEEISWELLKKIVFGEESCPSEIENVGKRIAKNCRGLPLALQVIGGLLAHSGESKHFWEHVAYNVSSLIAKTDDQFSGIFSWSFAHLPHYLKPCFLYMAAFPEDHAIPAPRIVRMWVAEGFLYPIRGKTLEEAAKMHLNALVDRNLIFVRERKDCSGEVISYGIHDLLRDLCLRKAQEKKFLHVRDSQTDIQEDTSCLRRVSVHLSRKKSREHFLSLKLTSLARSLLVDSYHEDFPPCLCSKLSLLRVLHVYELYFSEYPEIIFKLVNLRYLAIRVQGLHQREQTDVMHNNISKLKNLQTLIVETISLAVFVDLPQLRHLKANGGEYTINEFSYERISGPHENLQSINRVQVNILLKWLCGKLPNVRRLRLSCWKSTFENIDLTSFHKLEILYLTIVYVDGISNIIFPVSLKKLTLRCEVPQFLLDAIGRLPNLQILKFIGCVFENSTWEPTEDEFLNLQYLEICATRLKNWLATEYHFPALRHLFLNQTRDIVEIPNDFGGIQTLEIIELDRCALPLYHSAMRILEEQRQFGNDILQLRLSKALDLVTTEDGRMLWTEVPY